MTARRRRAAAAAVGLLLGAAAPAAQPDDAQRQQAASLADQQAAQARAAAAQAAERRLANERVAAAARLRKVEIAVADLHARVSGLEQARDVAARSLASRAAELEPLVPVAVRLARFPAETLLGAPLPPNDAVRGVLVLAGLARTLEQEAASLQAEQARVAAVQALLGRQISALDAAEHDMATRAAALDAALAEAHTTRQAADDVASEAARRAAEDAARAETVRAAIARLEAARREAQARAERDAARQHRPEPGESRDRQASAAAGPPSAGIRGHLVMPVPGQITRSFGAETDGGPAAGVSFTALPGARVVSPCRGRAVFAGPFRSYGLLLIIDCGGGYHFVLSGLNRLDAQVGQTLQAGEPVGVMAAGRRETLYLELRRDGQPTDPAPLLSATG